jgi:hypothetical protein
MAPSEHWHPARLPALGQNFLQIDDRLGSLKLAKKRFFRNFPVFFNWSF